MSQIKISVPNDDHVALRAMAKALEEIAVARGAPAQPHTLVKEKVGDVEVEYLTRESVAERLRVATEELMQAAPAMLKDNNVDGSIELHGKRKDNVTVQQVDSASSMTNEELDEFCPPPTTDSTDTPWDERIHSASKALNSDGTWRVRRKPADKTPEEWAEYIKWVEEDIHTVQLGNSEDPEAPLAKEWDGQGENVPEPARIEPSVTPAGDDFHVDAGEVTEQEVASIPAPPPPPPVFASVQEVDEMLGLEPSYAFPQVMQFLTERYGRITSPQVDQIIADMGLNSIMDIRDNTEHAGPFIARVKALLGE